MRNAMPRTAIEDNKRMSLRISPDVKSKLVRAAALRNADLTNFVTQAALREAEDVIQASERIRLTEQSYQRALELIENPPMPNSKLIAAAKVLPKD